MLDKKQMDNMKKKNINDFEQKIQLRYKWKKGKWPIVQPEQSKSEETSETSKPSIDEINEALRQIDSPRRGQHRSSTSASSSFKSIDSREKMYNEIDIDGLALSKINKLEYEDFIEQSNEKLISLKKKIYKSMFINSTKTAKIKVPTLLDSITHKRSSNISTKKYLTCGHDITSKKNVEEDFEPFKITDNILKGYKTVNFMKSPKKSLLERLQVPLSNTPLAEFVTTIDKDPNYFKIIKGRPLKQTFNREKYMEILKNTLINNWKIGLYKEELQLMEQKITNDHWLVHCSNKTHNDVLNTYDHQLFEIYRNAEQAMAKAKMIKSVIMKKIKKLENKTNPSYVTRKAILSLFDLIKSRYQCLLALRSLSPVDWQNEMKYKNKNWQNEIKQSIIFIDEIYSDYCSCLLTEDDKKIKLIIEFYKNILNDMGPLSIYFSDTFHFEKTLDQLILDSSKIDTYVENIGRTYSKIGELIELGKQNIYQAQLEKRVDNFDKMKEYQYSEKNVRHLCQLIEWFYKTKKIKYNEEILITKSFLIIMYKRIVGQTPKEQLTISEIMDDIIKSFMMISTQYIAVQQSVKIRLNRLGEIIWKESNKAYRQHKSLQNSMNKIQKSFLPTIIYPTKPIAKRSNIKKSKLTNKQISEIGNRVDNILPEFIYESSDSSAESIQQTIKKHNKVQLEEQQFLTNKMRQMSLSETIINKILKDEDSENVLSSSEHEDNWEQFYNEIQQSECRIGKVYLFKNLLKKLGRTWEIPWYDNENSDEK